MEKVYLLTSGMYEDAQNHGIFASIEDAERASFLWGINNRDHVSIEEWKVQAIPLLPNDGRLPFTVTLSREHQEHPIYVEEGWFDRCDVTESYTFNKITQMYVFYVWANSENEAKQTAIARLSNL